MVRISAARVIRVILGLVIVCMTLNFGYRFLFDRNSVGKTLSHEQALVNYMAKHLQIRYEVTNNLQTSFNYIGRITFYNAGMQPIKAGPWKIHFFHPVDIENVSDSGVGAELANRMMFISHINGGIFKLQPTSLFAPLEPKQSLKIPFQGKRWIASKVDVYPNWYVSVKGAKSKVLANTAGESLSFVGEFDREPLWKMNTNDKHNPFTPKDRFLKNEIEDLGRAGGYIIPTPLQVKVIKGAYIKLDSNKWVIVGTTKAVANEISYLRDKTGLKEVNSAPKSKFIRLQQGAVDLPGADIVKNEAYSLIVDKDTQSITITGTTPAGVFYGVQSCLSLLAGDQEAIPIVRIFDAPRFRFRGFMLDVARNFRPKEQILDVIDLMATYKLNKFHFHLTDDEGWRIQIPGLPELTEVGSRRCDDVSETECLLPFIGAGVDFQHDGYYSVSDYKDILLYAKQRHVEVIPEVDVPGHMHAAIKAMELRYKKLQRDGKKVAAEEYLLSDPDDQSKYRSVQQFRDNVMNVCMKSSLRFMELILTTFVDFHKDIMPLKAFHVGGDEVPVMALINSSKCKHLMRTHRYHSQGNLTTHFARMLLEVAGKLHLTIHGWEDMFYKEQHLQQLSDPSATIVNVWANSWGGRNVFRAHHLANHGHKVVLGPATHLYLDHPHEPHPEERGLFWATRFVDSYKVFGFMPENYYSNIDFDLFGHRLTFNEVCGKDITICPVLLKPHNIIGIESHLWGETLRTEEHLHMMMLPRLLAMAERAWHRANWELLTDSKERSRRKHEDWTRFANTLGYHELPRLEMNGFMYHLPVPGALVQDGKIKMNSAIPGLPFVVSKNGGKSWTKLRNNFLISKQVLLATCSHDGKRRSRSIAVAITKKG